MYEDEIRAAERAVRLASKLCESVQRGLSADEAASKSDESPVTIADYGSQVLVSWALQRHQLPCEFSMVAEEDSSQLSSPSGQPMLQRITALVNQTIRQAADEASSSSSNDWSWLSSPPPLPLSPSAVVSLIDQGGAQGGRRGRHWVLDPIDGTRGFVRGDQYAIALGLLDGGEVVLGVLGCPNLTMGAVTNGGETAGSTGEPVGCLFSAVIGQGTTVEPLKGAAGKKQLRVSAVDDPVLATFCESFEARHSKHGLTARVAQVLGVVSPPVRLDSQAKYGCMARGDAAIYMRFPPDGYREKIWDHAAGSLVITEAGGLVCDAAGKPLDFSCGRFLDMDTGIIATNAYLMPVLLRAVQSVLKGDAGKV